MSHIQTWPNIYTDKTYFCLIGICADVKQLNNPDHLCSSKILKDFQSRSVYLSSLLQMNQRLHDLLNSL